MKIKRLGGLLVFLAVMFCASIGLPPAQSASAYTGSVSNSVIATANPGTTVTVSVSLYNDTNASINLYSGPKNNPYYLRPTLNPEAMLPLTLSQASITYPVVYDRKGYPQYSVHLSAYYSGDNYGPYVAVWLDAGYALPAGYSLRFTILFINNAPSSAHDFQFAGGINTPMSDGTQIYNVAYSNIVHQ